MQPPAETKRLTADPELTEVPAVGLSLTTFPWATVLLTCCVMLPLVRPTLVITLVAAAWVRPTTLGTETIAGPEARTRFTADPKFAELAAAGVWLITVPTAIVLLACDVTVPTTRPTLVIALMAAAWLRPTTLGTETIAGPEDRTRFTADPKFAELAAAGVWLITVPTAIVLLACNVTVPTTRPTPAIALVAEDWVKPTVFGTKTVVGNVDG
jgi:hypothetical protein